LPQGGLGEDEEPLDAARRELLEETGIPPGKARLLAEHPEWLAHELPKERRTPKTGRGQVQKWFVFRFQGTEADISLDHADEQEFRAWKWTPLKKLASEAVAFRRGVYLKLAAQFPEYFRE
jgi:putative (di)nucleoside polyphosphate hydrolase